MSHSTPARRGRPAHGCHHSTRRARRRLPGGVRRTPLYREPTTAGRLRAHRRRGRPAHPQAAVCIDQGTEGLSAEDAVRSYKNFARVERTFGCLKTVDLRRPIHHRAEKRVRAHLFLCVLAYHVE